MTSFAARVTRNIQAVQRAAQIASSEELTRLERKLPWLATTGAVAPFIGLFGTVWGIIDAFNGLGDAGSATLRAVAPGISEALITTAVGLFAAIPAVIAYNQFTHRMREFGARMDDFSMEMLNFIERHHRGDATGGEPLMAFTEQNARGMAHPRPHGDLAFGNQRHAVCRRGAGAADHLYGHRAGAAIRH